MVRKSDPIYQEPVSHRLLGAHFYAPVKWVLGWRVHTRMANVLVLWGMTLIFMFTLHSDLFRRAGDVLVRIRRGRVG